MYESTSVLDAITMAIREEVTRDTQIGQGNGLWGLTEIIKENNGQMNITSGTASLFLKKGDIKTYNRIPCINFQTPGTIIDFEIDISKPINIAKSLHGHQPMNFMLESLESDTGDLSIKVADHAHGTGTRKSGEMLRNFITNLMNQGSRRMVLDFSGIAVTSSSFGDEFIAKLVVRYGFYGFQKLFILNGMNDKVQGIVHRSVAQRMAASIKHHNNN